jgi:hypothetical protein
LNLYGFQRITQGRDKNAYYHKYFLRGQHELTTKIPRTAIKGTGTRPPTRKETEPDFYKMPYQMKSDTPSASSFTPDTTEHPIPVRTVLLMTQQPTTPFFRNDMDRNVGSINAATANIFDTRLEYANTFHHTELLPRMTDLLPSQRLLLSAMAIPSIAPSILGSHSGGMFPDLYEESRGLIGMTPRYLEAYPQHPVSNFASAGRVVATTTPLLLENQYNTSTASALATLMQEQIYMSDVINRRLATGTSDILNHVAQWMRGDNSF